MFVVFDEEGNEANSDLNVVHTKIVRRRASTSIAWGATRAHGIGVNFKSEMGWNKCSTFDGTTCGASTHAVIIALEEMLKHPDDLEKEWRIQTRCRFLANSIQSGSTSSSLCGSCRSNGDPAHVAAVRRLLGRFTRPVQIHEHHESDDTARRLALMGIRRLYGTGDSDCSDSS